MSVRLHRCVCLLSVCALAPHLAVGQRYSFKYYAHEQGLEDLTVTSLLQDRTGFLWLGTINGLFRYDGARFQLAEGLPSTRIFSLAETADGTLLVATREGLAVREGAQFRRVGAPEMRAFPGPQSVAITHEGKVYVAAPSGLWVSNGKLRPADVEFRKYVLPHGIGDQGIFSAYSDAHDALWFGCDTRLCQLGGRAVKVFGEEAGIPPDYWRAIARDGKGRLWIRSATRLLVRGENGGRFTPVKDIPNSSSVESLYVDQQGRLLVPTRLGLVRGDGDRLGTHRQSKRSFCPGYIACHAGPGRLNVDLACRGGAGALAGQRQLGALDGERRTRRQHGQEDLSGSFRRPVGGNRYQSATLHVHWAARQGLGPAAGTQREPGSGDH